MRRLPPRSLQPFLAWCICLCPSRQGIDLRGLGVVKLAYTPPPVANEQFCPKKIRSERECSLDTPFVVRDSFAKQRYHIPRHNTPSPFKVQSDGGLQLALSRVEALVAVPLHAEKLNMLPGLRALLVVGTGRSGSLIWLRDLWDGHRLYSTSWAGASRESVMVGNRGPVVEAHNSLTSCFINLPTVAHYNPSFPQSFSLKPRF